MIDKECKSKCVCQASGLVQCEKFSCASGEVCHVRDGVRGCQVKQSQCSVSHTGQLTSFDGMSGAIKVKGAFEVASVCDEASPLWFRVVADLRVCRRRAPPTAAAVYVFFKEATVAVNSKLVVWVRRADGIEIMIQCLIMKEIIRMFFLFLPSPFFLLSRLMAGKCLFPAK